LGSILKTLQKRKKQREESRKIGIYLHGFVAFNKKQGRKGKKGKFYFYNITSLGYGTKRFKKQVGQSRADSYGFGVGRTNLRVRCQKMTYAQNTTSHLPIV